MSKVKAIRYSYTESMEKLIIPRLKWLGQDISPENGGFGVKAFVPLPDEIKAYLMEAARKADERLEQEVPGGTSVMVNNKWPEISITSVKLRKINLEGEA